MGWPNSRQQSLQWCSKPVTPVNQQPAGKPTPYIYNKQHGEMTSKKPSLPARLVFAAEAMVLPLVPPQEGRKGL